MFEDGSPVAAKLDLEVGRSTGGLDDAAPGDQFAEKWRDTKALPVRQRF